MRRREFMRLIGGAAAWRWGGALSTARTGCKERSSPSIIERITQKQNRQDGAYDPALRISYSDAIGHE